MKFPPCLFLRSTLATVFCCVATSFLSAQTPTPTPPVDTDGDGVSDVDDGWPFFPQLSPPPVPECQYIIIDLGLGTAFGLNNLGDVVGETYDEDWNPVAVLWPLGQSPVLLGFLTNDATAMRQSRATAINDARVITGYATYTWDSNVEGEYPDPPAYPQLLNYYQDDYHSSYWDIHAFRWEAGAMTDLNDLSFGQTNDGTRPTGANKGSSAGWAINNTGTIVGDSDSLVTVEGHFGWHWTVFSHDPLDPHAVRFSGSAGPNPSPSPSPSPGPSPAPIDLNVSPGTTSAFAINDAGSIVGYRAGGDFGNGPESDSAFLVAPNGQLHLLGLAGGMALAINNSDHVIGYFGVGGGNSLWPNNYGPEFPAEQRVVNLGALSQGISNSYAVAINDRVQIVGGNLLWQNGSAKKLKDLIASGTGWGLSEANAINQKGWIAARGTRTGEYDPHAVLLLPVEIKWEPQPGFQNVEDNKRVTNVDGNNVPIAHAWMQGKGSRIFPDRASPEDQSSFRNRCVLHIKGAPNISVYLKAFDVDDATPDAVDNDAANRIDPNGLAGDDNMDTVWSRTGKFISTGGQTASVTLDANGEALVVFETTKQPGDNFRVALALAPDELNVLQIINPTGDGFIAGDSEQRPRGFNGATSSMLTVWRRLWCEFDSMDAPPSSGPEKNFDDGTISLVTGSVIQLNSFLTDEANRFQNGRIYVDAIGDFVVSNNTDLNLGNGEIFGDLVTVAGTPSIASNGRQFSIYDDDYFGITHGSVVPPRTLPYSLSGGNLIYTSFGDAFIEPKRVPESYTTELVPFKRNVTFNEGGLATIRKNLGAAEDFWVFSLIGAWQAESAEDFDPNDPNIAFKMGETREADNAGFIFVETIREQEGISLLFPRIVEEHVIVHEIGHMGKAPHSDGGIMGDGAPVDQDQFKPITLKRFRENKTF